ncbi:unnamed protein product [Brachionus calyciflorus]|uniref:Metalloendopeptidase n=1 Tax=Brachionus calyciflorus TaxID=104777 RepID=A0A813VV48_9BILA|nr:unnamed protein product [Brachionus calyciflorus]
MICSKIPKILFCLTILIKILQSLHIARQDIRYASYVFEPGLIKPLEPKEREPSEEKNSQTISEIDEDVIEGDILLRKEDTIDRSKRKIINEINFRKDQPTRWPQKIVPFEFAPNFPPDMRDLFLEAVDHWQKYTCIKFEPYDQDKHPLHRSRLYVEYANICGSLIGYDYDKNKRLSKSNMYLGRMCSVGNIIHELGHTIGFRHEHSRIDRDQHIKINYANMKPEFASQYDQMTDSQPSYYNVPYDLNSVMHYSSGGGAITALDSKRNFLMGQRESLSFLDIQLANAAYRCSENCQLKKNCLNGGFMDQFCNCICSEGFTGSYCENIIGEISYGKSIEMENLEKKMSCNFDRNNFCQWNNDKSRSTMDWNFNKPELNGITETQYYFSKTRVKLGPQNGDRLGNKSGNYIYLNSLRKTGSYANAILSSLPITTAKSIPVCLKFWYNMFQGPDTSGYKINLGSLSVSLLTTDGKSKLIWKKEGNQGIYWQLAKVDLMLEPPISSIYLEGRLNDANYGDLCIDDFIFTRGKCDEELIFGDWSEWSKCSTKCGKGIQTRTRSCSDSYGNSNIEICSKLTNDIKECMGSDCENVLPKKPKKSYLTQWSVWSKCSQGCNSYRTRQRKCINSHLEKCDGHTIEKSVCSKCKTKKNILEKGLLHIYNGIIDKNETKQGVLSEWSEWSSCYGMKNLCDPGIQIRSKTCLESPCKDEPKEVRKCSTILDVDLEQFCNHQDSQLDVYFECFYGHEKPNISCFNSNFDNSTGFLSLIDLSESKKLISLLIDNKEVKKEHLISLKIKPNESIIKNENNCLQVFLGSEDELEHELKFLSYDNNKELDVYKIKNLPESKLKQFLVNVPSQEISPNSTLIIHMKIRNDFLNETMRPLYFKSIFFTENSCKNVSAEEKYEHEIQADINLSVNNYTLKNILNFLDKMIMDSAEHFGRIRDSFNQIRRCGGIYDLSLTKKITISSPAYPYQYPSSSKCNYLLKSPPNTKIYVKIIDLDLAKSARNTCVDSLELRYFHLGQQGPLYCGTFTSQNQLELKSYDNFFMIIFRSDWVQTFNRRGFRIEAQFGYF